MTLIVKGIFNNAGQAQQAVKNLISSGFTPDCIEFSVNKGLDHDPAAGTKSKERKADGSHTGGGSDSVCNKSNDAAYKSAFVAGRASVVTVHAEIDGLAKLAAGMLDDSGAVDIEKKAAEYGFGGEIVYN